MRELQACLEYCKFVEGTEAKYAAEKGQLERSRLLGGETVAEDAIRPTGARRIASCREFDPDAAGGPLRRLDGRSRTMESRARTSSTQDWRHE